MWGALRRELLPYQHKMACYPTDVGLVESYPFLPGVKPGTKVFHRPTPFPPEQRRWVKEELLKLESTGVIERVAHCESAASIVLVEG